MTPRNLVLLLLALPVGGCVVGPNFTGPPPAVRTVQSSGFRRASPLATDIGPVSSRWWLALKDSQLTQLIDQGLASSPSVREAQARLRVARAALGESRAGLGPSGSVSAAALSVHPPESGLGRLLSQGGGNPDIDFAGFDATWELDLFGGRRRAIESSAASAQASAAQLADAQVELAADIARAYFVLREGQGQWALARAGRQVRTRALELTIQRRARGAAGDADVAQAHADLDEGDARIAGISEQVDQALDQIAILVGEAPGALDESLAKPAAVPAPPEVTPIGDPASLLRRRPDIRAAERRLAAGNAEVGRSVAQMFPTVSLNGAIGFSASDPGALLSRSSFLGLGGPSLTWNILDYARIRARIHGAEALRDADLAAYQRVVLGGLQDAEDSLSRYARQRDRLAVAEREAESAARLLSIAKAQRAAGVLSDIDVAGVRLHDLQAQSVLLQVRSSLMIDYVALEKSLGLGWE
jgi:NodT family efflux transporter outer membrane factor (OMF) lipoprotein